MAGGHRKRRQRLVEADGDARDDRRGATESRTPPRTGRKSGSCTVVRGRRDRSEGVRPRRLELESGRPTARMSGLTSACIRRRCARRCDGRPSQNSSRARPRSSAGAAAAAPRVARAAVASRGGCRTKWRPGRLRRFRAWRRTSSRATREQNLLLPPSLQRLAAGRSPRMVHSRRGRGDGPEAILRVLSR